MARILVVDDDELLRNVLVQSLQRAGHAVTSAGDGLEGFRSFRAEPPDLVITDIVMPQEDGVGLMMALRQEAPEVPVIAISGGAFNSSFYLNIVEKLGARYTLKKPFTPAVLLQAVDDVLAGGVGKRSDFLPPPGV
jgi:CheY-like chemotaxis protein